MGSDNVTYFISYFYIINFVYSNKTRYLMNRLIFDMMNDNTALMITDLPIDMPKLAQE